MTSAGTTAPSRPSPGGDEPDRGAALVAERTAVRPAVAIVLGSGLGDALAEDLATDAEVPFGDLPGFPSASVPGHAGRLRLGTLYGVPVAAFFGRVHFYEGHGIGATTLIPRLAAAMGAHTVVLTNACGGLDATMRVGQLMLINDHLNSMGVNPLFGWRLPDGAPAFVDISRVYDAALLDAARAAAEEAGIDVRVGVYAAVSGPSYETPAETTALARLGADAVGMSTVPEVIVARHCGLRVAAVSAITNLAEGMGTEVLSHEHTLDNAAVAAEKLQRVLRRFVGDLA
jgi:inosine/guanosine/xanthosine phosphorylase family protein